jgi:hypothetical protein
MEFDPLVRGYLYGSFALGMMLAAFLMYAYWKLSDLYRWFFHDSRPLIYDETAIGKTMDEMTGAALAGRLLVAVDTAAPVKEMTPEELDVQTRIVRWLLTTMIDQYITNFPKKKLFQGRP